MIVREMPTCLHSIRISINTNSQQSDTTELKRNAIRTAEVRPTLGFVYIDFDNDADANSRGALTSLFAICENTENIIKLL